MNDKNITIPFALLKQIIYFLNHLDSASFDPAFRIEYTHILFLLNKKLRAIDLRDAYAKIVAAYDDDKRHDARIDYLRLKNSDL